jgi:non-specific serine/threonine protein kinase
VAEALGAIVTDHRVLDRLTPGELTLWLPSGASEPEPSPAALTTAGPADQAPVALLAWDVPTLALDAPTATAVLLAASSWADAVPGDASFGYLAAAALFAVELAARGRILPGVVERADGRFEARWLPAPGAPDAERVRALMRAMPPVCRAEATGNGQRPGRSAAEVLAQVLADVVDAVARGQLAEAPAAGGKAGRRRTAPDALLAALGSANPVIVADPAAVLELGGALATWRRGALPRDQLVRTCFRLAPPVDAEAGADEEADAGDDAPVGPAIGPPVGPAIGPEAATWRLEILLQGTDDPSLLVPAADVWRAGRSLAVLDRHLDNPQERLLADLGRATRLHPGLERALREARPAGLDLDTTEALAFLRDGAPVLAEAGFGIQLPSWWQAGRPRISARLKARTRSGDSVGVADARLGLDAICDYDWEIAVGDATLTAQEVRELARLKVPLVRVRGLWVELHPEDLAAAARLVGGARSRARETLTAGDVLRIGLGLEPSPIGLPVTGVTADGWLSGLLGAAETDRRPAPHDTPAGFNGTLRPYQERGLAWLEFLGGLGLGACLADDMGLGKTAQVLALLVAERAPRLPAATAERPGPTLVVCPMSVVENWRREAEMFAPGLAVHVHHGSERLGGEELATAAKVADLVVTTYGLAARDLEVISAIPWSRLVLDEAQNVKNSASRQAQAVRHIPASRRIALTGTPVENHLSDLWSIMEILNPGLLGSASAFRQRFAIPIERYGDEDAAGCLRRATAPFILRRLKSDRAIISDLPDKLEMTVLCSLTREQATLYQAVIDEMMERIESSEKMERRGLVLATMLRLKQVCNHPAQMLGDGSALAGRSGKLARVEEILEEVLAEGDRALLFTQFAEFGSLLRTHLRDRFGREVLYLHGGTPKRERDAMVARFGGAGGPPIFILSLKAGGTGLNLTAANHVIHVDRWWNPAVEDQATDRAHRIGQQRSVQVRKLVCAGTLEERIATLLESKRALADRVVGTGETWLTELSTAELRDLVALSADAVAEG